MYMLPCSVPMKHVLSLIIPTLDSSSSKDTSLKAMVNLLGCLVQDVVMTNVKSNTYTNIYGNGVLPLYFMLLIL